MFPCTWEIEVPFNVDDEAINQYNNFVEESELYLFKCGAVDLYEDYCDGRCEAYYEFENTNDL
jgi:hypothetical protein